MGTITPAYGRDYKSKKEALADWNAGKDFVMNTYDGSGYCSKRDFTQAGTTLQIRWKKMTQVAVIKFDGSVWK